MEKDFAIKKAGSAAALARLLGISKQAVAQWQAMLPPLQAYRLRELKPRWTAEWRKRRSDKKGKL
jgi:DNA-binding transcriptional regulator YdaS (Cro superfamily)